MCDFFVDQIAPGMSRLAIVELYATKSDGGELNHTLEICTEKNTQLLLIKANILSTGKMYTGQRGIKLTIV